MSIRNSAKAIIIQGEKVLLTKNQDNDGYFYPALTGSKTPTLKLEKIKRSVGGKSTARKSPIGSTNNQ